MSKRTVYYFTVYDVVIDQNVRRGPATLDAIDKAGGEPLLEPAHGIDESDLDDDGFTGWKGQPKPSDSK